MMRKCFALLLCFFQATGPALASVLTVEEVSVVGAAADDYYTGSRPKLKVINGSNVGRTLVSSAQLSSTAALSGLTAGAVGIAGIAYYERTGKDPVYAAANALASAADALFVPAYQAFKANFVSPETYPASAAQYVGIEGSVGATIGNIVDYVKNSAADLFPNLKSKIASATPASIPANVPSTVATNPTGSIWSLDNQNKIINSGSWAGGTVYAGSASTNSSTMITGNKVTYTLSSGLLGYMGLGYVNGVLYFVRVVPMNGTSETHTQRFYWTGSLTDTTNPISYPAADPAIDYDSLKAQLSQANIDSATADEIRKAVQEVPSAQKITSSDPSPSTVPSSPPSPITNNQIQNFFTENTTNVYNKYLDTVNNNVTNQGDITNEVAQASAELSKAQSDEVADETSQDDYFADVPSLDIPEIKEVDFSPVTGLAGEMTSIFPFGLIESISSAMVPFSATPQAPSFDIDLGFVRQTITFSSFDGVASFVRGLASFFFYCLTGLFCFRLYSRM